MKSDRATQMTPRIARKLAELGIVLPPETTIHEANRILSQALQPKKTTTGGNDVYTYLYGSEDINEYRRTNNLGSPTKDIG